MIQNQLKYHLNIYWSEPDNAFIAAVPELPGCMADGASYEEVIKNVQVIIQEWLEVATEFNRPIPEPVYGTISAKGLLVEQELVAEVAAVREEYRAGNVKFGSVSNLMSELDEL